MRIFLPENAKNRLKRPKDAHIIYLSNEINFKSFSPFQRERLPLLRVVRGLHPERLSCMQ